MNSTVKSLGTIIRGQNLDDVTWVPFQGAFGAFNVAPSQNESPATPLKRQPSKLIRVDSSQFLR
jgi:hypothetical protein